MTLFAVGALTSFSIANEVTKLNENDAKRLMHRSVAQEESLFQEDILGIQQLGGALFSPIFSGKTRETFNYAPSITRFSWMLNTPEGEGFFRGNVEAVFDLFAAGVFSDFGSVVIGPTALVRYNFVQPGWKFIPYIQGGAGIVYTDGYEKKNQRLIGQAIEFTPQASVGFRYLIDRNWSITPEVMFHHISNANMASRNVGINSLGGFIGVSYLFDRQP